MKTNEPDPVELLHRLTADELAARIDQLGGEISSLRVLLRAARTRERANLHRQPERGADNARR